jgi:hypothetical protein
VAAQAVLPKQTDHLLGTQAVRVAVAHSQIRVAVLVFRVRGTTVVRRRQQRRVAAVVVLVVSAQTVQARLVVQVVRQARTHTQELLFRTQAAVVVAVPVQVVRRAPMAATAAAAAVLMPPLIVAAVAVVQVVQVATAETAVLAKLSCVGSPQMQQVSASQPQARQRTEPMVLTLGMRGKAQELWWWRNGTFRKD